jgi:hypothetical protein
VESTIDVTDRSARAGWILAHLLYTYVRSIRNIQIHSKSKLLCDSQSVSMSWYPVPLWDLRPDINSCRNVALWNLRSCIYCAPSLTRGRVCNLQRNHSIVRVAQNPKPYFTVSSETPPTWRSRFPYLYPPGTGWPSYTPPPGHWVPLVQLFLKNNIQHVLSLAVKVGGGNC